MKREYCKYGFAFACCVVVLSASACSNASKNDSKSSYVIQEIIATKAPENQLEIEEEVAASLNDNEVTNSFNEVDMQDITKSEVLIISDASSASQGGLAVVNELPILGSVYSPANYEVLDQEAIELINAMPASSIIKTNSVNAATLASCFTSEEISPIIFQRMENKSFSEGCTTEIKSLRYVRVLHYGFDGEIHVGELIVNQLIVKDILEIFKELFDAQYPIEQMVLIDEYDADDILSMEANNTSCFNFRMVDGTTKLSKHSYGLAIDINPLYNPYIRTVNGEEIVLPASGSEYVDRSLECQYYIKKDDVVYKAFTKRGFTWGGDWTSSIDYQHFQKLFP